MLLDGHKSQKIKINKNADGLSMFSVMMCYCETFLKAGWLGNVREGERDYSWSMSNIGEGYETAKKRAEDRCLWCVSVMTVIDLLLQQNTRRRRRSLDQLISMSCEWTLLPSCMHNELCGTLLHQCVICYHSIRLNFKLISYISWD